MYVHPLDLPRVRSRAAISSPLPREPHLHYDDLLSFPTTSTTLLPPSTSLTPRRPPVDLDDFPFASTIPPLPQHPLLNLSDHVTILYSAILTNTYNLAEEDAYQIARYLMKDTCDMEIMIARHLMKELGDTLRTIFRRVPQDTQAAEWLMDHTEDAASMLKELIADSPLGPEYLEHLMLGLYEAESLINHLPNNLTHANNLVEATMYKKKQYQVPILDCWAALSRAEAFGSVLDGCDIKL